MQALTGAIGERQTGNLMGCTFSAGRDHTAAAVTTWAGTLNGLPTLTSMIDG